MSSTTIVEQAPRAAHAEMPPLESGDRLTRREFERRYAHTTDKFKAELIEGRVYVASPVRLEGHGEEHAYVMGWLVNYVAFTKGIRIGDNSTVRLDADNEPQPDGLLLLPQRAGGKAFVGPDGYVEGPPELVVEIAASSAAYDLHDKRDVYRRNGVREYAVWQIHEQKFDWWTLEDEVYQLLPLEDGVVKSRVFPGLWLHTAVLLQSDMAQVLVTLQQGLASEEHAAFVARIAGQ